MKPIVKLLPTLVAMLLARGIQAHGKTFYVSPSGTKSGENEGIPASIYAVAGFINDPLNQNPDNEVIIRFAPGVYELTQGIPRNLPSAKARVALLGANPCRSASPTVFKWKTDWHSDPGKDDEWR
jgi:hypothetical protein